MGYQAERREPSRVRRVVERVEVPVRCVVCGEWFNVVDDRGAARTALTCGVAHRQELARMRKRRERPPFAV